MPHGPNGARDLGAWAADRGLGGPVWSATGLRSAGKRLVDALGSEHEDVRSLAGRSLVQARARAEPLLEEALARGENVPLVLTVLGDIGDPESAPLIARYREDPDPQVARAACDALRTLRTQVQTG